MITRSSRDSILHRLRRRGAAFLAGRMSRSVPMAFVAALAVLATPIAALAQDDSPPQPVLRQAPPQWIGYAIMFVMVVIVLFLSLMSSKRSHQD